MSLSVTIGLCIALAAIMVAAGWAGARPPDPRKGPRLVPWRFIMLLAAAGLLLMMVHLINLMGLRTGR